MTNDRNLKIVRSLDFSLPLFLEQKKKIYYEGKTSYTNAFSNIKLTISKYWITM